MQNQELVLYSGFLVANRDYLWVVLGRNGIYWKGIRELTERTRRLEEIEMMHQRKGSRGSEPQTLLKYLAAADTTSRETPGGPLSPCIIYAGAQF